MNKNFKVITIATCLIVSAVGIFTFSVTASNIENLRPKAIPAECVTKLNHDCRSPHTGNIYSDHVWKDCEQSNF